MLRKTVEIIGNEMKAGKSAEEMKNEKILEEWKSWNSKSYDWLNVDFWIDTVYESLSRKVKKN